MHQIEEQELVTHALDLESRRQAARASADVAARDAALAQPAPDPAQTQTQTQAHTVASQ